MSDLDMEGNFITHHGHEQKPSNFESLMEKQNTINIERRNRPCCACCCLPKYKPLRLCCLISAPIILTAMIIAGYFLWPKFPQVSVNEISLADLSDSISFSLAPNSTNYNTLSMRLALKMSISCYNPNPYGILISQLQINAYLAVNKTEILSRISPLSLYWQDAIGPAPTANSNYTPSYSPLIGMGNATDLDFPARTTANFSLIFILAYSPDPMVGLLRDPAFAEFLNVCGITSRRRFAKINYDAISTVGRIYLFGYKPKLSSSVSIGCPATADQIDEIRNSPDTPEDPLGVIKKTLGNDTVRFT